VLRRVLAQQMLGEGPTLERLAGLDARFRSWIARGDMRHAREMALFYLHVDGDLSLAYELAQHNFRIQREPEDRALLCEAAARLGERPETECSSGARRLPMIRAVSSAHDH
jgi:hypothetical protein